MVSTAGGEADWDEAVDEPPHVASSSAARTSNGTGLVIA
jgi:hypothetical protein